MSSPWRAIAFVAGVAAATTVASASAQPIVSPSEAEGPAPKPSVRTAETKSTQPAGARSKRSAKPAGTKSGGTKSAKSGGTKSAKSGGAKSAKSGGAKSTKSGGTKSTRSAKSSKGTKPSRSTRPRSHRSSTPSTHSSAPAPAGARLAAIPMRSARADNMPRGFAWPATPAMRSAGKACEADLDALGVSWKPSTAEGRIASPVEVPDGVLGGVQYTAKWRTPPHTLDCQLARALAQIGRDLHAIGVREVRWGSIYRWSNVRTHGKTLPFLSRHALGLAMDVVEFVDDTGRVVNVQRDYLAGDRLLLGVEQLVNASGKFRIVLTPRNDPKSHHDHFHLEANPDYTVSAATAGAPEVDPEADPDADPEPAEPPGPAR